MSAELKAAPSANAAAPPSHRLEFVDALRGFALLGVFWANLLIFAGIEYMSDAQRTALFASRLDTFAYGFEQFFVDTKFMGLFSTLFGISFWLFLTRVGARGAPATRLFYRRIFWLFVIGCVHWSLLWLFDILSFYALWAIFLPLFAKTPPRRLLGIALGTAVLAPALVSGLRLWLVAPAPESNIAALTLAAFAHGTYAEVLAANWRYNVHITLTVSQIGYQVAVFGRLLLGLYLARTFDFDDLGARRPLLRRVLLVGGLVGLVGCAVATFHLAEGSRVPLVAFLRRIVTESGRLGLTLAYAAGFALLFLAPRARALLRRLAPLGQMALTFYLGQTLFGIFLFYGFPHGPALMSRVGPAALIAIVLVGYPIQIALARAWLARFRFGPAEWVWRCLTYGKLQPFRRAA